MVFKNNTKQKLILEDLLDGKKLTTLEAVKEYGTIRLSASIHVFRKANIPVITTMVSVKNEIGELVRYAVYWIPPSQIGELRERHLG